MSVEIEVQLKGTINRKRLRRAFGRLGQDEAAVLLGKLLRDDGSRLSKDFRRLSRHVRLQMLLILVGRLGTRTRESFYYRLTGRGAFADVPLQKGLRWVFPAGTEIQRDQFLKALEKDPANGIPSATLTFRGHHQAVSFDNLCEQVLNRTVPAILGVNAASGQNWMEIRATVSGHRYDAEYQFHRSAKVGEFWHVHKKDTDVWKSKFHEGPDDSHDQDEDLTPDNDHIYVVDGPGTDLDPTLRLTALTSADDRNFVSEYVFVINAEETAKVKVHGAWFQMGKPLKWYSVTWLEKVNGAWQRKPHKNAILEGEIEGLETMNTPKTPSYPD